MDCIPSASMVLRKQRSYITQLLLVVEDLTKFIEGGHPIDIAYLCRGVGMGKQVGSMDEESQVRGCYKITFICTPTNQETV